MKLKPPVAFFAKLIAVFLSVIVAGQAQRRPRTAPTPRPQPSKAIPASPAAPAAIDIRPFDIRIDKLTPGFAGHDIKAVYNDLVARKNKAVKGEFETTREFEARLQRETEAPILGKLDRTDYLAFVLQNSSGETLYDADAKTMTIAIALSSGAENVYTKSDKMALTSQAEVKREEYEGSNAYGAKGTVTRHSGVNFNVAFSNYSSFGVSKYIDSNTRSRGHTEDFFAKDVFLLRIPMDVALAKEVKANLKILAVVKLIKPYTYEGTFYDKPTISRPTEYFIQYHFLNTELIELWLFDESTGRIFIKKRAS
jgi:hypothetical protein